VAAHHPIDPKGTRCPCCMKPYDFGTDGIGNITGPFHQIGDCKPREAKGDVFRYCEICGERIGISRPGPYKKTCSPKCRARLDEINKAARQLVSANKSRQMKQEANKGKLA
jgi:hypothetical protein